MKTLFSFSKLLKSIKIALSGIRGGIREEQTFRFEIFYGILTIILGFLFSLSTIEFAIIMICIGITLGFELMNSQIEKVVNIARPEFCKEAKMIKDMSAGAVLIIVIASIMVGIIIFLPHFLTLLKI